MEHRPLTYTWFRHLALGGWFVAVALSPPLLAQDSEGDLNRYLEEMFSERSKNRPAPGSLYSPGSYLTELPRDPKAAQVGDLITIRIAEQANALSSGQTTSSRQTTGNHAITALLGPLNPAGTLPNLGVSGSQNTLNGQGSTARQTSVTTTMTAHVTHVMPNGNLVIRGIKEVVVNSERQVVSLRGVVRQVDLQPDNSVRSDRIAMAAVAVNGKGVVNDSIKRPHLIARILRGILPF